jgi:hypothetical protein
MYTVKKVNDFPVPARDVRFWPDIILNCKQELILVWLIYKVCPNYYYRRLFNKKNLLEIKKCVQSGFLSSLDFLYLEATGLKARVRIQTYKSPDLSHALNHRVE